MTDGETLATIPAEAPAPAPGARLPDVRAIPATAISLDLITGELAAPLGAIEHLADALKQLARALGGRSVATAEFATSDPGTPITLAAREGEPAVLAAGRPRVPVQAALSLDLNLCVVLVEARIGRADSGYHMRQRDAAPAPLHH